MSFFSKSSNIKRNRHCFLLPIQIKDFFFSLMLFSSIALDTHYLYCLKMSFLRDIFAIFGSGFISVFARQLCCGGRFFSDWIDDISFSTLYLFGCAWYRNLETVIFVSFTYLKFWNTDTYSIFSSTNYSKLSLHSLFGMRWYLQKV